MDIDVELIALSKRGKGKTTVLRVCKEALEKAGYTVSYLPLYSDHEHFQVTKEVHPAKEIQNA